MVAFSNANLSLAVDWLKPDRRLRRLRERSPSGNVTSPDTLPHQYTRGLPNAKEDLANDWVLLAHILPLRFTQLRGHNRWKEISHKPGPRSLSSQTIHSGAICASFLDKFIFFCITSWSTAIYCGYRAAAFEQDKGRGGAKVTRLRRRVLRITSANWKRACIDGYGIERSGRERNVHFPRRV